MLPAPQKPPTYLFQLLLPPKGKHYQDFQQSILVLPDLKLIWNHTVCSYLGGPLSFNVCNIYSYRALILIAV